MYDSTKDTLLHMKQVSLLLNDAAIELIKRSNEHDLSKLGKEEKQHFDEYTEKLKGLTYGSDEYKKSLEGLKPALDHHYSNNRHHPEYHTNGIDDMNLFDVIEMILDWLAATQRHDDGDILKSIEINKKRFNMEDQLVKILTNTVNDLDIDGKGK